MTGKRYSAFISYNHRDRRWAVWLHRALERYRIPKKLHGRQAAFGTIGSRLRPNDVRETRDFDRGRKHVEPVRAPRKLRIPARSGWTEGDIDAAGGRNEIPHVGSCKRGRRTVERQALRNGIREHPGIELPKRRRQSRQVVRGAIRRDGDVGSHARKTVETRAERSDQDVCDTVFG